jgi:ABC-type Na+ efflux pump permease subunit|tara:strand:- start:25 stop:432 length:408 start_codon:yes stop_codon:yes gene_type:complete
MKSHFIYTSCIVLFLSACGGKYEPTVVVDNSKVSNIAKYNEDKDQCVTLAKTIDLNSEAALKAFGGAAAGGIAVAGVATAVAGAVFLPALPFIAAGSLLGGGAMGAGVSAKEKKQRNQIFGECMRERGYRAYVPS